MNVALQKPWTADDFLAWAEAQDEPYEFDGVRPVAMTGGTVSHDRITGNISSALRSRLRGTACSNYGPNLGLPTINDRVRYPDALITCAKLAGNDRIARDALVVFEVLSPTSGGTDRIEKVREYQEVPSILRYVIVESATAGVQVLHRADGEHAWTVHALNAADTLELPEVGIELPVAELYEDVVFPDASTVV